MEQSPAFQALLTLANQSKATAKGLPAQEQTKKEWSGIGFGLLGHQFVVPMGQVSELLEVPSYTRLPGVKPWVRGVSNVRGRLLPVIDLASFLGHRLNSPHKQQRILVLEGAELYCGLLVDQSYGIQHFLVDTYQQTSHLEEPNVQPFLLGSYELEQGTWHVFSMVNLIEHPDFISAARTPMAS